MKRRDRPRKLEVSSPHFQKIGLPKTELGLKSFQRGRVLTER